HTSVSSDCSFYSSRPRHHLHSFPTRRSSDLISGLNQQRRQIMIGIMFGGIRRDRPGEVPDRRRPITAAAVHFAEGVKDDGTCGEDRKSTRLNSSHVSISYAVFCLKKKTEHHVCGSAAHEVVPAAVMPQPARTAAGYPPAAHGARFGSLLLLFASSAPCVMSPAR